MRSITAVVPARKEKSRLLDKNILPFGESNLLLHKIRQLKKVQEVNEIVVSSEDKDILEMAEAEGVAALRRPQIYAEREKPFAKFVEYICGQLESGHILWACVTSPFITEKDYTDAIALYFDKLNEGYDSLVTVKKLKRYILDKNGAVNFKRGVQHKNSEDLSDLYLFTNGIVLAPREKMIEWKYNWGHIPYMLEVSKKKGIDISDQYDYEVAKLIYQMGEQECEK